MHPAVSVLAGPLLADAHLADKDYGPNPFGIAAIVVGVIVLIILIVTLRR